MQRIDTSFSARSKITEHVETFSFLQKTLKIENHVLGLIKIADQMETIRQSMRCCKVHVHKKGKDQRKSTCKHDQNKPQ